jgi:hypothetical protein
MDDSSHKTYGVRTGAQDELEKNIRHVGHMQVAVYRGGIRSKSKERLTMLAAVKQGVKGRSRRREGLIRFRYELPVCTTAGAG